LGPGNTAHGATALVRPVKAVVRYHIIYAIPAFICALLLLIITLTALVAACIRGGGTGLLRRQLQALSAGRIYTVFMYPEEADLGMRGKEWGHRVGDRVIDIGRKAGGGNGGDVVAGEGSEGQQQEKVPFVRAESRTPSQEERH
jgi:hypothetical protein